MGYFKVILVLAQLGPLTAGLAVAIALITRFGLLGIGYAAAILGGACCAVCWIIPVVRMGVILMQHSLRNGNRRPPTVNYAAEHMERRGHLSASSSTSAPPSIPKV